MTVMTRAAVSFSFSLVFTRDLLISLQHTLHYVFHSTLVLRVFSASYCCGCIIDMSESKP